MKWSTIKIKKKKYYLFHCGYCNTNIISKIAITEMDMGDYYEYKWKISDHIALHVG